MTDPKFTPGPWGVVEYGDGDQLVICTDPGGDWRICFMATHVGSRSSWEKIQADANLISAAPDLYEALKVLLRDVDGLLSETHVITNARAALAKARGETVDEMAMSN